MEQALAIQLKFDIKQVRRAVALLTGDAPSDEEIQRRFFDREPIGIDDSDLPPNEAFQMCAAFVAFIIAAENEN